MYVKNITLFPLGAITNFDNHINIKINKELLMLLGGPLFQILFLLFICILNNYGFINSNFYEIFIFLNKYLLLFNLLPIYPLDGNKLLYLFLCKVFSYKKVLYLSNIISVVFITLVIIFTKYNLIRLLVLLISKEVYYNIKNSKLLFNKFLLERSIYDFNLKKSVKIINNINRIKKDRKYNIIYNNMLYSEKDYLKYVYYNK